MKLLDDYYNPVHGLELEPNKNTGDRNNENGILFLVEFMFLSEFRTDDDVADKFNDVVKRLEVEKGLYDRGALDGMITSINGVDLPKRTISHDNISAISAGSRLINDLTNGQECFFHHDIAEYGLKHFFVFNNNRKGFRAPMNPGNYSIWLALGQRALILQILFLPFYLINFFITNNKPANETSGKLLNFVELYPLRKKFFWSMMYKVYTSMMRRMYDKDYMVKLTEIYFKDEKHPVRIASLLFQED